MTEPRPLADVVPIEANELRATRMPPYAREVVSALTSGRLLNVAVFAGPDAWDQAEARRASHGPGSAMVLPKSDDPANFSWPIVNNGLLVVALGQSRACAFSLARAIASCGSPLVYAIFGNNEALIVRAAEWRNPLGRVA
jgi:hypothetical protein